MGKKGSGTPESKKPFDWNQPAKDVAGNVITPDDPQYMEKLREADMARMTAELTKLGGVRDKFRAYEAARGSSDINTRLSVCHIPQQKAGVLLECLDPQSMIMEDHEVLAILPELERIRDTQKGKPEPVPYEMYQALTRQIDRLREGGSSAEIPLQTYSEFTNLLIKNGLIATSPRRGAAKL